MHSTKSSFQRGDVLYGKLRPYLDKAVLAEDEGICTTELLVLRAKDGVDPRFLAAVLHSPTFVTHAVAGATGVQHPRTSWAHIREFELPAFNIAERGRIADLVWLVHRAIVSQQKIIESGKTLKHAAMRTLFTRGLRGEAQKETEIGWVPESWGAQPVATLDAAKNSNQVSKDVSLIRHDLERPNVRISELCNLVANQVDPKNRSNSIYVGLEHLTSGRFAWESAGNASNVRSSKYLFRVGDVLYGKLRPYLDKAAHAQENGICTTELLVLRPKADTDPRFLVAVVHLPKFVEYAISGTTGVQHPRTSWPHIREFQVPAFSRDQQQEIGSILNTIECKLDLRRCKRTVLDELFKALLHKLMIGEIRVADLNLAVLSKDRADSLPSASDYVEGEKMLDSNEKRRADDILAKSMPSYRKAYSDRTAWLMAYMAELAYLRFDEFDTRKEAALKILMRALKKSKKGTADKIIGIVRKCYSYDHKKEKEKLSQSLEQVGWQLVETISANATQAFLACNDEHAVLAFRGTEADRVGDIKADAKATQTTCPTGGRTHSGFKEQYDDAQFLVEKALDNQRVKGKPLFVTGHSLGGAVATTATKRLSADRKLAACYTFGSLRVGAEDWVGRIKTPIYRVVNSADPVPLVPFSTVTIFAIVKILRVTGRTLPFPISLLVGVGNWLERTMSGYAHAGNMRFLTDCKDGDFSKAQLLYTVGWGRRFVGFLHGVWPWGKILSDHGVSIYRTKLMHVAESRNR